MASTPHSKPKNTDVRGRLNSEVPGYCTISLLCCWLTITKIFRVGVGPDSAAACKERFQVYGHSTSAYSNTLSSTNAATNEPCHLDH